MPSGRLNRGWLDTGDDGQALAMEAFLEGDLRSLRAAGAADVRLNGNCVDWIPTAEPFLMWMPPGAPVARCLDAFCDLAVEPTGTKVLAFVKRYGVLELTEGGAPACGLPGLAGSPQRAETWRGCMVSWEPIAGYVAYARSARTFRRLASELRRGVDVDPHAVIEGLGYSTRIAAETTEPSPEPSPSWLAIGEWSAASGLSREEWIEQKAPRNWHRLLDYEPLQLAHQLWARETIEPKRPSAEVMRQRLATYFQHGWIRPSGLVPRLYWSGDRPRLALGIEGAMGDAPPLFRVLALQLAAAIMGEEHAFTCSACGVVGYRERRPRTDQNALCDRCRARAGSIRTARYRQRKSSRAPQDAPGA